MSCLVLDIDLADENVIKELEFSIVSKVQGHLFRPPKTYKPTKQAFILQETCTDLCRRVDVWITVGFPTFFLEM